MTEEVHALRLQLGLELRCAVDERVVVVPEKDLRATTRISKDATGEPKGDEAGAWS